MMVIRTPLLHWSSGGPKTMSIQSQAHQLTKAKIASQRKLMKSDAAREYMKKAQLERSGAGNGYYQTTARSPDGKPAGTMLKADGRIRTIQDMVDYWYGFVPDYYNASISGFGKADAPVLTTTPGYRNAIFGSEVFYTINHEANAYALLENRAWVKSGERTVVDYGHTLGSGGEGENAEIPDTAAPDVQQYEQEAKTIAHSFDVSQVKQLLADTQDDDLDDPFDWLRRYYGEGTEHQTGMGEHPKHLNVQLLADADSQGADDLLSIDTLIQDEDSAGSLNTSSNADIYGFDRSNGEFESNVIDGGDRTFTIDLLDDAITSIKEASGKNPIADDNYFFLTNHDTFQRIEEEVGGKERLEAQRVSIGLNGVNTQPGDDVGITVNSYKQIPIFESVDVTKDGIGRVYLVDSSTMFMKTLLPTQFYDSGTEVNDDPYAIGRLGNQGLYVTIGETTVVSPASHAKIQNVN